MKRRAHAAAAHPVELHVVQPSEIIRRDGALLVPCACGKAHPLGNYGAAQLGAGNALLGKCPHCERAIRIEGR